MLRALMCLSGQLQDFAHGDGAIFLLSRRSCSKLERQGCKRRAQAGQDIGQQQLASAAGAADDPSPARPHGRRRRTLRGGAGLVWGNQGPEPDRRARRSRKVSAARRIAMSGVMMLVMIEAPPG